jgi:hypothetical protein
LLGDPPEIFYPREQTGAKTPSADVRKFVELHYLNDAIAELGKR